MAKSGAARNYAHEEQYVPRHKPKTVRDVVNIYVGDIDYTLLFSVVFLTLFGIVMVFSSSYYAAAQSGSQFDFLVVQGGAGILGFTAMLAVSSINYNFTKRFSFLLYAFSLALLVLVLILGLASGGATRWLHVPGTSITFQPSEITKIAVIVYIAHMISAHKSWLNSLFKTSVFAILVVIAAGLVVVENLSTALIIMIIGFGMIFIASPFTWTFVFAGISGAAGLVSYLMFFSDGFRGDRFQAWLDPFSVPEGTGYQILQSLYAIGSGGFFGLGLGQSRQKLDFLPEAHNDMIFAIIAEETGLLGAGFVLFLFGVFLWRAIKIALSAPDLFGSLVASGIAIMIGAQVLINVGVVTNSIPNTGIPLPFISYGGTSLSITLASVGLLLSISRYTNELKGE